MSSPEKTVPPPTPLALLVPVGNDASKAPQPIVQPIMVLRSQGVPFAVLLVSPHHAYIKAIADSELKINDRVCREHELASGDRIGLGPVAYQFRIATPQIANGKVRNPAFLRSENGVESFPICLPITMIGKGQRSDIQLNAIAGGPDIAVVLELQDGHALVSLNSPPEFSVNGATRARHRLVEGDVIQVGERSLKYLTHPPPATATESSPPAEVPAAMTVIPPQSQRKFDSGSQNNQLPAKSISNKPHPDTSRTEASMKAPLMKVSRSPATSNSLAAWGPLAQAVISGQSLPTLEVSDDVIESVTPRRRWWVVLLIMLVIAGGGVAVWLKWGAALMPRL